MPGAARDAKLTRRQAFALAGAGALAAAAGVRAASADVPMQGAMVPDIYRFSFGDMEVTTIREGAFVVDGPYTILDTDVAPDKVRSLAVANFLPPEKMEIGFAPTLLNTGSELILFDSGNGAGRRPNAGQIRQRLAGAGVPPEAVDIVVLTHFHPDHIGGLMEDGAAAFPNARYAAAAAEYDFWSPPRRPRPRRPRGSASSCSRTSFRSPRRRPSSSPATRSHPASPQLAAMATRPDTRAI